MKIECGMFQLSTIILSVWVETCGLLNIKDDILINLGTLALQEVIHLGI